MPYRFEIAKSNRASCSMAACKQRDAKIPKGVLKFGTLVQGNATIGPFFTWKHWGCVSDRNLQDLVNELGDDIEPDGFELLDGKDQDRVTRAMAVGHIADEDKTVFSEEESRKYQDFLDDEEHLKELKREAKQNGEPFSLKDSRARLRDERLARYKMERDEAKLAEADARRAAKQAEKEAKASKVSGTKRKAVKQEVKNEDDVSDDNTGPKKRQRLKSKLVKTEDDDDDLSMDSTSPSPPPDSKAKPKSKATRGKPAVKTEPVSDDDNIVSAPVSKAKTNVKAAGTVDDIKTEVDDDVADDTQTHAPENVKTESSIKKTRAAPKGAHGKKQIKAEEDKAVNGSADLRTTDGAVETNGRVLRRSARSKSG